MIALDLFAGSGWGVACQRLGIEEYGVEIMSEARATREANGMHTIYEDVWEGLLPKREARKAMGRGMVERHGDRPGRRMDQPAFTIRASAGGMEPGGFVWGESAPEVPDYDLLIASPPCQTFSMAGGGAGRRALDDVLAAIDDRLYMDPAKLQAFGEKHDPRTALVLTPLSHVARDTPTYVVLEQVPPVLPVWEHYAVEMRQWGYSVWTGILNAEQYGVPQTRRRAILIARADGTEAAPPTPTHSRYYSRDPKRLDENVLPWVSMAEALGWGTNDNREAHAMRGKGQTERYGDRPGRKATDPSFTLRANGGGNASGGFRWMWSNYGSGGDPAARGERGSDTPAPTMTSKADRNMWTQTRPASTIVGTRRSEGGMLVGRQLGDDSRRDNGGKPGGVGLKPGDLPGVRVTVEEAAALQSYPPGFVFAGTKTKQFLQVGNAVPPLLAEAILRTVL